MGSRVYLFPRTECARKCEGLAPAGVNFGSLSGYETRGRRHGFAASAEDYAQPGCGGAAEAPAATTAAEAAAEKEILRGVLQELEQLREERRQERYAFRWKEREIGDCLRWKKEKVRRRMNRIRRGATIKSLPISFLQRANKLICIKKSRSFSAEQFSCQRAFRSKLFKR